MGIYINKMYSCTCDVCNDVWRNNNTDVVAFSDVGVLKEEMEYDLWIEHNEKWYCPDCYYVDEDDNFHIDMKKSRTRKLKKLLDEKQQM